MWTFSGGTATASFTSGTTPGAVTIPAGGDVSTKVTLSFAAPSSSGSITFSTAENECCGLTASDVSPPTLPADNENYSGIMGATPNHPILYISFYNPGPSSISFEKTPAIVLSPTAGGLIALDISGDDECQFDYYALSGGALAWTVIAGASVMLDGEPTSVSIPSVQLPGGGTLEFEPGQTLGAVTCD
jgi:hypothetical protein